MKELDIHNFFTGDWAVAVNHALAAADRRDCQITFRDEVYDFYPENAYVEFTCISNHAGDGERPFAFPLYACKNVIIKGSAGTLFRFHGNCVPFLIRDSEDVKLAGFSIDWALPFYSQGTVKNVTQDYFDLQLGSGYCGEVRAERWHLRGQPFWGAAEMEPEKLRMKFGKALNFREDYPEAIRTEILSNGNFRLHGHLKQPPDEGSLLVLRHGRRDTPAIFMNSSVRTEITNIKIYQACGMGVIAQNCRDITLTEVSVAITPGSGRLFSLCADAVHMVNCMGELTITDSSFENQFDDAINIHGVYTLVTEWLSPSTVKAKLEHRSQKGLVIGEPGQRMRFVERGSLRPLDEAGIKTIHSCNHEYSIIEFNRELPVNGCLNLALENLDLRPASVTIRNCVARNNNPRGFLISTGGQIMIEDNFISAPGAGIRISGDAGSWFESGPVESVTIRNNRFEFCNYYGPGGSSRAVIDIVPELSKFIDNFYYHREIIITGNTFADCNAKILYGWSVDKLWFENNLITNCRAGSTISEVTELKHCGQVMRNNNSFPAN